MTLQKKRQQKDLIAKFKANEAKESLELSKIQKRKRGLKKKNKSHEKFPRGAWSKVAEMVNEVLQKSYQKG